MKKIRIAFVDFWPGFDSHNNYFYYLLSTKYNVTIDYENPDLLFFSVDFAKRKERDRYSCPKIFFTGESASPNFDQEGSVTVRTPSTSYSIGKSDLAFTFDISDDPRNKRLPLWVIYLNWFGKNGYGNPSYLMNPNSLDDNRFIRAEKNKFCAIIYNNPIKMRKDVYKKLSEHKQVDGHGRPFNCHFDGEERKHDILKDYRFSICYENNDYPGYHTEKLLHAKTCGNLPIYWGAETVKHDFHEEGFINALFFSEEELFDYVKFIDEQKSQSIYNKYISKPLFPDETMNKINKDFLPDSVLMKIEELIF